MAEVQETTRERSRSRDNDFQEDDAREGGNAQHDEHRNSSSRADASSSDQRNDEVHNLYITNLSFQTTDESLRAAFEAFGELHNASVIKEPVTHVSRGFGFVSFLNYEDSAKALEAMHGGELDGRAIRVEKARRNNGYQKTPGVYLGPPQLSSKFPRSDSRGRDRGPPPERRGGYDSRDVRSQGGGGGYRGGGDDRYARGGGYDRPPTYRDDRGYDMPPMRGDPRGYGDYRGGRDQGPPPRYDPRGPPPMYDDRRGPPPRYFDGPPGVPRGRSPPRMDPGFRRERSPPRDDRRGGYDDRGAGPPPAAAGGYGSGASAYYRGPPRF